MQKIIPSLNIAPLQLLSLWTELEQCYYDDNGYGGNTAELYAYRFQGRCPTIEAYPRGNKYGDEARHDMAMDAAYNLYALLEVFAGMRNVRVEVEGKKIGPWIAKQPFDHRVHVKVIRKEA